MFGINLTNEEIQLIHNAVNHLAPVQGPPGLNPPANLAMLALPNVAGNYHFGVNQKDELLRILDAEFELLDLDIMVVFGQNRNRAEELQEKQEKVGDLIHKINTAQQQGGKRKKTQKRRKTKKVKKSRRTKH